MANKTIKSAPAKSKNKPALRLDQVNEINPDYTAEQQTILDEITPYVFSPDPYIELKSLEWLIGICGFEDFIAKMSFYQFSMHPAQMRLKPDIEKNCQQHQQNYPNLIALIGADKPLDLFKPQSELGRLMNMNARDLSPSEKQARDQAVLAAAINSQNSGLLLNVAMSHSWGGLDFIQPFKVLNTQDKTYAMRISNKALSLLACEYGASSFCNSTSTLMVLSCLQYPAACGQDYISWYQQNTLPGMQKDVEKLKRYYQGGDF